MRAAALVARVSAQHIQLVLGDSALDYLAAKVGGRGKLWLLLLLLLLLLLWLQPFLTITHVAAGQYCSFRKCTVVA
jgi:hypothetical protein